MSRIASLVITGAVVVAGVTHVWGNNRTIQDPVLSRPGTPLASLIKPGQTTLIVEKDQSPPLIVEPPAGVGQLEWLTSLSPVVLLIRVERIVPQLTPTADWIKSTVHASVEQILKSAPVTMSPDHPIRFVQDGGEMQLSGARVRALLSWADSFQVGQRYLVFADPTQDPDLYQVVSAVSYRIDPAGETLVPLARRGQSTSERDVSLNAAVERVKTAAKKKDLSR